MPTFNIVKEKKRKLNPTQHVNELHEQIGFQSIYI